jgi:hypothetical protein
MSVAAATEASDLEQTTIVTNGTASKNQSGDCEATLPKCCVGADRHANRIEQLGIRFVSLSDPLMTAAQIAAFS